MKKLKTLLTIFAISVGSLGSSAYAAENLQVTVDKGSVKLKLSKDQKALRYTIERDKSCKAKVSVKKDDGSIRFSHDDKACSKGAVITITIPLDRNTRVSLGGGVVDLIDSKAFQDVASRIVAEVDGGVISGNTRGFDLKGKYTPTRATYSNAKAKDLPELNIEVDGGVINFKRK